MECMVQDGSTPLLLAVRGSHDTIVKALVAAGADASGPLYDACQRGDTPIVKVLLGAPGVNPNVAQAVRGAGCVCVWCRLEQHSGACVDVLEGVEIAGVFGASVGV